MNKLFNNDDNEDLFNNLNDEGFDDEFTFESDVSDNSFDIEEDVDTGGYSNLGATYKDSANNLDDRTRLKIALVTFILGIIGIVIILVLSRFKGKVDNVHSVEQETQTIAQTTQTIQTTMEQTTKEQETETTTVEVETEITSVVEGSNSNVSNSNIVDINIVNKLGVDSIRDGTFTVNGLYTELQDVGNSSSYVASYVSGKIDGVLGTYKVEVPISLVGIIKEGDTYNISYSIYTAEDRVYVGNIMFK